MDRTYTKLDLEILMDSNWSALENYFRIDDAGIWLLTDSAPEFRGLTQDERDLFMTHPDGDRNFPVLTCPFTVEQFLKFAMLPVVEIRDIYTFADNTINVVAIEKLERMHVPAGALARALVFGELPKWTSPEAEQCKLAIADAESVVIANAPDGVEPNKVGTRDKGWVMKKAALIKKHAYQWRTINRDFQDARENKLLSAAKASGHGAWFEAAALDWARQRGKLTEGNQQGPANLSTVWTGTRHTKQS